MNRKTLEAMAKRVSTKRSHAAHGSALKPPGTPIRVNVQPPESSQLIGVREKAGKSSLPTGLLATMDSSVVCTMCSKCIEEASETCEGEDVLFCEGSCQRWYHRWCVGVCREQFQPLTESSEPFLCHLCISRKQQSVILELQENV